MGNLPEHQWNTEHLWYDRRQRIPMETKLHEVLHKRNCDYIVDFLGSRVYPERGAFRSYQEFCPNGNLFNIMRTYASNQDLIPEPFIWYTFLALAEACLSMRHIGSHWHDSTNDNLNSETDIIHLDLKPENGWWSREISIPTKVYLPNKVFLANPSPVEFDMYPTPKVSFC